MLEQGQGVLAEEWQEGCEAIVQEKPLIMIEVLSLQMYSICCNLDHERYADAMTAE